MIGVCHIGDCRDTLRSLADAGIRVQTCVTSPPYWGLRDYGVAPSVWGGLADCDHAWGGEIVVRKGGNCGTTSALTNRGAYQERNAVKDFAAGQFCSRCGAWLGCLGLEPDYRMFIAHLVEVFDCVRDVLADDGTLWLNLGDSYATGAGAGKRPGGGRQGERWRGGHEGKHGRVGPALQPNRMPHEGLKAKDLCMIPARVAIALQERGWYVRADIIWHKPNPMPESVTDRPTKAHEYLFLLAKSERYYYDAGAIKEPVESGPGRCKTPDGWDTISGDGGHGQRTSKSGNKVRRLADGTEGDRPADHLGRGVPWEGVSRNKRSVWTVTTKPFTGAHFAAFPPELIEPCILAGSRPGDIVLDPFMGSGTTAQVAEALGRQWVGCELNAEYLKLQQVRLAQRFLGLEYAT